MFFWWNAYYTLAILCMRMHIIYEKLAAISYHTLYVLIYDMYHMYYYIYTIYLIYIVWVSVHDKEEWDYVIRRKTAGTGDPHGKQNKADTKTNPYVLVQEEYIFQIKFD